MLLHELKAVSRLGMRINHINSKKYFNRLLSWKHLA